MGQGSTRMGSERKIMSGFAEVPMELAEEKKESIQDECQMLGGEITRLAGVIDDLESKLAFVLESQHDTIQKESYPELGPGRSDCSAQLREQRTRMAYLIHGLSEIVLRLDL